MPVTLKVVNDRNWPPPTTKNMTEPRRAILYTRVSTETQDDSGLGRSAQLTTLRGEVERRGWTVHATMQDTGSGKSTEKRPQLAHALEQLAAGEADALVVAKLDRLSRSLYDFTRIMRVAAEQDWAVVAIDIGIDTSTINGELVANIIMSLAQWERRIIVERVKAALVEAKTSGTKLGRKFGISPEVEAMLLRLHTAGHSYGEIARRMNDAGVPTAQRGQWRSSTVRYVLQRSSAA